MTPIVDNHFNPGNLLVMPSCIFQNMLSFVVRQYYSCLHNAKYQVYLFDTVLREDNIRWIRYNHEINT